MSDTASTNFATDNVDFVNCKPIAELRQSLLGEADLRAQWMAEYAIDTGSEPVVEEREMVTATRRSSLRRQYGR